MAPIYLLRPSCVPWTGGVISLTAVVDRLKDLLPPTFEDLNTVSSAACASLRCYPVCLLWTALSARPPVTTLATL